MYAYAGEKTPDPSKTPPWLHEYESPGGPTDGAKKDVNLLASRMQPTDAAIKRKAGRY